MTARNPSTSDIPGLRTLWKEAFGDSDSFLDIFFSTAFSTDRCLFIPDVNGAPVSALYLLDCSYGKAAAAYIYAVATAKDMQGRGLGTLLMKETAEYLSYLGYDAALLVPGSPELRTFYERLGYKSATSINVIKAEASGKYVNVTSIDKDEYSLLRRSLLPENAVIQGEESMSFLSRQASFCKGDGFLLAYRAEGSKLFGIELLGETSLAPDITSSLGFDSGVFRICGDSTPFAMHLALTEKGKTPPSYFAFAFD